MMMKNDSRGAVFPNGMDRKILAFLSLLVITVLRISPILGYFNFLVFSKWHDFFSKRVNIRLIFRVKLVCRLHQEPSPP